MRENKSNLPIPISKLITQLKPRMQHAALTRSSQFSQITLSVSLTSLLLNCPDSYYSLISNLPLYSTLLPQLLLSGNSPPPSPTYSQSLSLSRLRIAFTCLPYSTQIYRTLGSLTRHDIGGWLVVQGTVIRMTQRRTLEKSKMFECQDCGYRVRVTATYHNSHVFEMPPECPNIVEKEKKDSMLSKLFHRMDKRRSKSKDHSDGKETSKTRQGKCGGKKFKGCAEEIVYMDYQEFKLQEPFRHLVSGRMPQTITVLVEGESLIDACRPGDDIYVSGVLHHRFEKLFKDRLSQAQLIIVANTITDKRIRSKRENIDDSLDSISQISLAISEANLNSQQSRLQKELKLRQQILALFCPQLYARSLEKLGVLLCLLGGVSALNQSTRIRGQSHLLLVGQPGTGKSVLLKAAAQLSQRSFFLNAICCSSAGLTVTHLKEKGCWVLEPGALVLADQGVCCIDELNMMDKKDLQALLQAMEQQTVSSAKAGVISKLNCRTTVLAACNPVLPGQKLDKDLDMITNTGLSPPLMSRFDLVLALVDQSNAQSDFLRANHILEKFIAVQDRRHQPSRQNKNLGRLRAMIKKARTLEPQLKQVQILQNFFVATRQEELKTVRALESMCRLAQAHAKLMMRQQTTLFDCVSVIMLTRGQYASTIEAYQEHLSKYAKFQSQ